MTKTFALLLDSYRELNAKRLFWIVLVISALVVGAFAMIGLKNNTLTVLWWDTPFKWPVLSMIKPAMMYKVMFSYFGVGFWLTWLANILALVSTAGIFPDLMAGGSIDLYLSKPISRLRLFLTKYIGGLLFVTLQVAVFSGCSFLVIGFRGHEWEPSIFLSIPLVVLVFSYLFAVCVLLGIMTRSTIASLLLTLLVWFAIWGVRVTEGLLLFASIGSQVHTEWLDKQIADGKQQLENFPTSSPTSKPATSRPAVSHHSNGGMWGLFSHHQNRASTQDHLTDLETERATMTSTVSKVHGFAYAAMLPLPKMDGTTAILDRELIKRADLPHHDEDNEDPNPNQQYTPEERRKIHKELEAEETRRNAKWTLGTSVGFELAVVCLAAWMFCRRDY